jgi:DedD protein
VDTGTGEVQAARPPVREERVVAEEAPRPPAVEPSAEDLTYAQRLESERPEESLGSPRSAAAGGEKPPAVTLPAPSATETNRKREAKPAKEPATAAPSPAPTTRPEPPKPEPVKPGPAKAEPAPKADAGKTLAAALSGFTIQVGAFKDKATAESVAGRLKSKGYAAYLVSPDGGGLFNVRVGSYPARADAERVLAKLRDEEKFKPFIVKP